MRGWAIVAGFVLVGCGSTVEPVVPVEREFAVLTQSTANDLLLVMQEEFGATCERRSRHELAPGSFGSEPTVFREVWACAWAR